MHRSCYRFNLDWEMKMKTITEPKNKAFSVVLEIIFLLLIVSMVFSIAGCDNTTKEDDDTPTPPISFTLSEYD